MKRAHYFLQAILTTGVALLAAGAIAQTADVDIATELDEVNSGDFLTSGTRVRVLVTIASNSSAYEPSGVALKITYPTDALSWGWDDDSNPATPLLTVEKALDPDPLDALYPWDVVGNSTETADPLGGSYVFRRISTVGEAIGATPDCFYVNFTKGGSANATPFNIEVATDPNSSNPVPVVLAPGDVGGPAILALTPEYSNEATTNITRVAEWMMLD